MSSAGSNVREENGTDVELDGGLVGWPGVLRTGASPDHLLAESPVRSARFRAAERPIQRRGGRAVH